MQQNILFNTIFNKNENDWDTFSFLTNTAEQYPYFGLAHFYALKKSVDNENKFANTAQKTALFFNNPFYLQSLLKKDIVTNEGIIIENETEGIEKIEANDKDFQDNGTLKSANEHFNVIPSINNNLTNVTEEINLNPLLTKEELIQTNGLEININTQNLLAPDENVDLKKIKVTENASTIKTVFINEEAHAESEKENGNINKEVANAATKEEMLFEPLHATDYFASQGIKITDLSFLDDKLGKQLKSFTSWLKTMKKVHPDKLPIVTQQVEKAVQSQAAKSNEETEIVTEAMAEAFEQQGKNIRALEVYEKLSLLNPAKSAYFAAKIDQLKK